MCESSSFAHAKKLDELCVLLESCRTGLKVVCIGYLYIT